MHFRRTASLALVAALATPLFAFHTQTSMAEEVVAEMNVERAEYGLKPLHIDEDLSAAALDRIDDMMSKHYFGHIAPDGIKPWTWADKHGYNYHEFGENLAVGYRTPKEIVDGWMHSPEHRANVLSRTFEDVGVAIAAQSPERRFAGPTVVAIYGVR